MNVLLLAGDGNNLDYFPTQALRPMNNRPLIDVQISSLKQLGLNVHVVLNQGQCESILRESKELSGCELIFDPNEDSQFFSLLSSGCHSVNERCLIMPLHAKVPPSEVFSRLEHHFYLKAFDSHCHILRPFVPLGGQMEPIFPLMATRVGVELFRSKRNFTELTDSQIRCSPVPVLLKEMPSLECGRQSFAPVLA